MNATTVLDQRPGDALTAPTTGAFRLTSATTALVAAGVRGRVEVPRWDRSAAAAAEDLLTCFDAVREPGEHAPILVGVVPFDTASAPQLMVPEAWSRRRTHAVAAHAHPVAAAGARAHDRPRTAHRLAARDDQVFRAAVAAAVARIDGADAQTGPARPGERLEKVVLSRQVTVELDAPIDRARLRAGLRAADPRAWVFDVEVPGGHLVGASPELLVSVRDGLLVSTPLAGSAPRSPDPVVDRTIADALLRSAKDRHEHAFVTDMIRTALRPFVERAEDLIVPAEPSLVATSRLWHLGTEIRALLRPGVTSLDVALALHPTPAVCGHPRDAARALIADAEPADRGFYAGLVGWADASGDGEWAITLRCGLVRGTSVTAYAGAGVVSGSTPDAEHAETATKLGTFLDAVERAAAGATAATGGAA